MRSANQGAIPSELGDLIDRLNDYEERLRTLEAPSGEALSSTVAKLQALVANIQAQLDAWVAGRWTNAQITTEIANAHAAHDAGNVTIGGELRAPNAYNFDITYTRRTAWWGNDGRAGYASSSRTKKTGIKPADEAELARLLEIEPKSFYYKPEIARRTRLRINDGVDYTPTHELGLIAEELDDAGLGFFVYHNDETGVAEGIEYGMLTVALLAIARGQHDELAALRRDVDGMKGSA